MGLGNLFKGKPKKQGETIDKEICCPRCKISLAKRTRMGVTIDKCLKCGGIWLDKGEIFRIINNVQLPARLKKKRE